MSRRSLFQLLLATAVIVTILLFIGGVSAQGNRDAAFERVKEVQEGHTASLMAKPGVVGTAIGLDERGANAVLVLLEEPGIGGIPQQLEGVPVRPVVTGKVYALKPPGGSPPGQDKKPPKPDPDPPVDPTARFRPAPIGVSTGNAGACIAGTIGCWVTAGGNTCMLSNNHVLALEEDPPTDVRIVQPGLYDAEPQCVLHEDDIIATVHDVAPIEFSTEASNVIDAAIAVVSPEDVVNATPTDGYGTPKSETTVAHVGMRVQKYGRTTGLTNGRVRGVNTIVYVEYDSGVARFVSQIMIGGGNFSAAGDSGSLVVEQGSRRPVGLLFAGGSGATFANPIDDVLSAFDVPVSIDGE